MTDTLAVRGTCEIPLRVYDGGKIPSTLKEALVEQSGLP
jgi:hypothetical protein